MNIVGGAPAYGKDIQRAGMAAQLVPGLSLVVVGHREVIELDDKVPSVDDAGDRRRTNHGRQELVKSFQLPAFEELMLRN